MITRITILHTTQSLQHCCKPWVYLEALSLWLAACNSYRSSEFQIKIHVYGFEHETAEMGRVTQGLWLNIVLNPRSLFYRIKLVPSSNYILHITTHVIAWLQQNWTSASRCSKNSWIGDSFDRLCVRGERRYYWWRRRTVLRDYV